MGHATIPFTDWTGADGTLGSVMEIKGTLPAPENDTSTKKAALHESKDPHTLQVADRKHFTLQSMWDNAEQVLHLEIVPDKVV